MKKKLYRGIFIIFIGALLFSGCVSTPKEPEPADTPTEAPAEEPTQKPTPEPAEKPTEKPEPAETQAPEIGEFWIEMPGTPVSAGSMFSTEVRINTGKQKIAAYGIKVTFDPAVIDIDSSKGNNGVDPGADGFVAATNSGEPGSITIAGFDVFGKGPGKNLHIMTIHWKAVSKGSSAIGITVKNLVDENVTVIGAQAGLSSEIVVK